MYKKWTSLLILFFFLFSFVPLKSVRVLADASGPTGLTSVAVNQYAGPYVSLNWTAVSGASSYKVYRSEDGGSTYTMIASPSTTTYKDTTAVIGTVYTYQISAVVSGTETAKSSAATAKVNNPNYKFDVGAGPLETGYTAIGYSTLYTAELGYGFNVALGGRDRGNYADGTVANNVYRDWAWVGNTTFKVKLPVGTYSIDFICGSTSVDSKGGSTTVSVNGKQICTVGYNKYDVEEGYGIVSVTTNDPLELNFTGDKLNGMIFTPLTLAPANLKVDNVDVNTTPAHIDLSWTAAQEPSGYNIYRKAVGDNDFTKVGTSSAANYKDDKITIGKTYSYYVANIGVNGEAPSSVIDNVKAIDPTVAVPTVPAGFTASRQPNSATLTWTKDSSVLFYTISRKSAAESDYKILTSVDVASAGAYADTGLVGNMNYTYQLIAVNRGGDSDPASADANALIPIVPTSVVVEETGWSVVDLLSTANDDAVGCKVYRSDSIDGPYTLLGTATKALNAYRYKDTGLTANRDYYYEYKAYNYTGESEPTTPVKVTIKNVIAKPSAPGKITLNSITKSSSNYSVRVDWEYSYGATSYNVYRSTSSDSGFQKIGTSTNGVYTDTITNCVENTNYYYKVSAVNVSGESDASAVLGAKITSDFRVKPTGITAVSQMPEAQAITLNWTAVNGADSYNIYRSLKGDNNFTNVGTSTNNSFVDNTGVLGSSYEYRVSSVDKINGESLKTFALKLDWTAVTGISGYTVQRKGKGAADSAYVTVGTASTNSYIDDTAVAGIQYEYRIMDANNSVLNHEYYNLTANEMDDTNATMDVKIWYASASITDSGKSIIKDTVKKISYSYDGDTFKLSWKQVDGATSYNVYKSTVKDSGYHFIGNSSTNEFVYKDNDEAGTYYYKVTALNAGGESEKSEALTELPKVTLKRQMEKLDRGLIAVKTDKGVLVSWRYLGTDSPDISFNVYRDGVKLNSQPITSSTNYTDAAGTKDSKYYVAAVLNNSEVEKTETVDTWTTNFQDIPLKKPAPGITPDGKTSTYYANDASVADLDGDGKYEIILKWQGISADNSQFGYTNNTLIDAYKLDGTFMWRIDLGKNIRAGAHYTDMMAYDFDGDGKAELALKTADGTIDGQGNIIGDEDKDYRNTGGFITDGPEYDTVFEGATGKALATVPYEPQRGLVTDWGDGYGNRVDRFLAGVAYIDGKTPCFIEQRGYYTRMVISAFSYKDGKITKQWQFDSNIDDVDPNGVPYKGYEYQGNHQMEVGDVDGDGKDEIITGASCIDNNGKPLYTTGIGHGDAMHLGDLDPTRPGLEVFQVHEDGGQKYGEEMHDALTGQILWGYKTGTDTGRGLSADIDPNYPGEEAWSGAPGANTSTGVTENGGVFTAKGERISDTNPSVNFAIWWDGDLSRELLDQDWNGYTGIPSVGRIDKWDYVNKTSINLLVAGGTMTNNGSKGNPSIQADIFGDWREEVMWPTVDNNALRLYVTPYETENRIFTLMHDPIYRLGVAWENTGYNQPPHTSFFLGNGMTTPAQPNITYTSGGEVVMNDYTPKVALEGTKGNGDWYTTNVKVSVEPYEVCNNMITTEYSFDGESWTKYTGTFEVTTEGANTLLLRSLASSGNVLDNNSAEIKIDKTAPDYKVFANGNAIEQNAAFDDCQSATFKVADSISGLKDAQLSIDGTSQSIDVTKGSVEINMAGKVGMHEALITAEDNAGNKLTGSFKFKVTTSISSMDTLMTAYIDNMQLKGSSIEQLTNSLKQAQQQINIGRKDQAAKHMSDFIKHLNNQVLNQNMDAAAKKVLNSNAEALVKLWTAK